MRVSVTFSIAWLEAPSKRIYELLPVTVLRAEFTLFLVVNTNHTSYGDYML